MKRALSYTRNLIYSTLLLSTLYGCKVGPSITIPPVDVAQKWQSDDESLILGEEPLELWELFDDPLLSEFLQKISKDNHSTRIALAKIEQAYAMRQTVNSKLFPLVDLEINNSASRPAGGILKSNATNTSTGMTASAIPLNLTERTFFANFDALWEIDFFGRTRHEIDSSTASLQMEMASYDATLLALMAEFGRSYLELRRLQKEWELTRKEATILEKKTQSLQNRLDHGLDSELGLLDNKAALDIVKAQIPAQEAEILHQIYSLSVMAGKPPTTLLEELQDQADIPTIQAFIPTGFPSDLLRRRPDIRLSEHNIAKATADLGIAVADLFPKITLTGNYGYQTLHLGNTAGKGASFGYGVDLFTPIFHAGSLKANVQAHKWMREGALISYEQTVYQAFEESETAIARFIKSKQTLQDTQNLFKKRILLLKHNEQLYENGLASELELLDAEQKSIQANLDLINQETEIGINLIALYKRLGGSFHKSANSKKNR